MRCPFCAHDDTQVKDSRPADDSATIRRRRVCPACGGRFTTFERVQLRDMTVVKTDGRRQTFDRDKIIRSMQVALRKRPVSIDLIERAANGIVRQLESGGEADIPSADIGEKVMKALAQLGPARFAPRMVWVDVEPRTAQPWPVGTRAVDITATVRWGSATARVACWAPASGSQTRYRSQSLETSRLDWSIAAVVILTSETTGPPFWARPVWSRPRTCRPSSRAATAMV